MHVKLFLVWVQVKYQCWFGGTFSSLLNRVWRSVRSEEMVIFTWRLESLLVLFISPFFLLPCCRNSFPAQFLCCWWQEEGDTAAEPGDAAVSQHLSASHNHCNICRTNILVSHCPGGSRWCMGISGKWDFPGIPVVGEHKPAFRLRDSRMKWDLVAVLITVLL